MFNYKTKIAKHGTGQAAMWPKSTFKVKQVSRISQPKKLYEHRWDIGLKSRTEMLHKFSINISKSQLSGISSTFLRSHASPPFIVLMPVFSQTASFIRNHMEALLIWGLITYLQCSRPRVGFISYISNSQVTVFWGTKTLMFFKTSEIFFA